MGLFSSLFHKKHSKDEAKKRLQMVLMVDRSEIDQSTMDLIRRDIIDVISKYIDIDDTKININLSHEDDVMALDVSVPVKSLPRGSNIVRRVKHDA